MAKVTLENVNKFYGETQAVFDMNLEIDDQDFLVLLGPSGCGKSTSLRMIAGLEDISSGAISIGDTIVNDLEPRDRDIAMVFQDYALYPHMTVYQNMAFGLTLRKFPPAEVKTRVHDAAEVLGIAELLGRKPKELSGGQRQRVALGRAIVRKPSVFLFDEPLSNLDAKLRGHMRAELTKLHQELQATIIYVTHDQVEAMTMATKIVIMDGGVVQQIGTPAEIYGAPVNLFVASFIGNPGMNILEATVKRVGKDLAVVTDWLSLKLPKARAEAFGGLVDQPVLFGVRPEDIEDAAYADTSKANEPLSCTVDLVETLGSEAQLGLREGGAGFVARVDPRTTAKTGNQIELAIDMQNCHLFSTEGSFARHSAG